MTSKLFSPLQVGALQLRNRILMSALTRARAEPGHIPGDLLKTYYTQRASSGLIFTEATMTAGDGCAFTNEAGIYGPAQLAGWKQVIDSVHAAGGLMALQIWHPGRASHPTLNGGVQPISSTDRAIRDGTIHTPAGKFDYPSPHRLSLDEIPGIVATFRTGAENAKKAGFDAIEVHGAHGYLLDQFLRDSVNDRTDIYGGSIENRARLLFEVIDAIIGVYGADRVGLRISPLVPFNDIADSDPKALVAYVCDQLSVRKAAFLDLRHDQHDRPEELALAKIARKSFTGALMLNGGFTQETGEAAVANGTADAIIYGKPFISNPDLVERFQTGTKLTEWDPSTFYSPGPHGYTDYPNMAV